MKTTHKGMLQASIELACRELRLAAVEQSYRHSQRRRQNTTEAPRSTFSPASHERWKPVPKDA